MKLKPVFTRFDDEYIEDQCTTSMRWTSMNCNPEGELFCFGEGTLHLALTELINVIKANLACRFTSFIILGTEMALPMSSHFASVMSWLA